MEKIGLYICDCLSCFIEISILMEFMNGRYKKIYSSSYMYIGIKVITTLGISLINLLGFTYLNFCVWVIIVAIVSYFLYYEDFNKPLKQVLECETLLFFIAIIETLGYAATDSFLTYNQMNHLTPVMKTCLEVVFSNLVVIFLYYLVVNKVVQSRNVPYTKMQYIFSFFILFYTLINIFVMVKSITERPVNYLLIMNLCGIVLADLYLLYFIKVMNEKTYLEYEVKLLENQAELQYAYYANQEQKYNRTIQILHDVDKHINSIEKLYENGISKEAGIYTRQIQNMLKPLIPIKYTGNPILDILLTDKALLMSDKQIIFNVKIDNVDLNFIDPIDVTTIWGNLLDNAIEACEQMEQETYITMSIKSFHEMVSINIANNCNSVIWKNGLPVSEKGNNRGIGLLNVKRSIEKYDGNMTLREENGQFTVEILLNT